MTVAPTAATTTVYALTASNLGPFATVWPFAEIADVDAYLLMNGAQTKLFNGSDFTVSGGTPLIVGGQVTLSAALLNAAPWPAGAHLALSRGTASGQPSAFGEVTGFSPAASEAAIDNVARQIQELVDGQDRALSVPIGETAPTLPVASARAGKYLAFDGAGVPYAVAGTLLAGAAAIDLSNVNPAIILALATFLAEGADAVAMPAISKMRQHYSLYDVIGGKERFNPASDYSGALQAAVSDLPASGGRIEIPAQPWLINAPVVINKNSVSLVGFARGRDQTHGSELYSSLANHQILTQGLDGNPYEDLLIADLTIANKTGVAPTVGPLIDLRHSYHPTLRCFRLRNYYDGINILGPSNASLDNFVLTRGVGAYGIFYDEQGASGTNVHLSHGRMFPMDGLSTAVAATSAAMAAATGAKSFTVAAGLDILAGQPVEIFPQDGTTGIYMIGTVTSYNAGTGALVCNIASTLTDVATTKAAWTVGCYYRPGHTNLMMRGASTLKAIDVEATRADNSVLLVADGSGNKSQFVYLCDWEAEYCNVGFNLTDYSRVSIRGGEAGLSRSYGAMIGAGLAGTAELIGVHLINGNIDGVLHAGGRTELVGCLVTGNGALAHGDNPVRRVSAGVLATAANLKIVGGKIGGSGNVGAAGVSASQNYGVDASAVMAGAIDIDGVDLQDNQTAGVNDPNGVVTSHGARGWRPWGTTAAVAGAATLNSQAGQVTTEALTTAAGAEYVLQLTNPYINNKSLLTVNVKNGTNDKNGATIDTVTCNAGLANIRIRNSNPTDAFDGTLIVSFSVGNG